jgi:hypothetical protein
MHALNFHNAEIHKTRVSSVDKVESLARKALKHIPGGLEAVERQFNKAPFKSDLPEPTPQNLILHMGHTR